LLGEDQNHERFALGLMRRLGFNSQPVKVFLSPSGRGAASAWVTAQYADVLRRTVRIRPGERVALVVMIDGDRVGVRQRKHELAEALRMRHFPARSETEPLAVLVPTWSIETWLIGLRDDLNETTPLKEYLRDPTREHFAQAIERIVVPLDEEPLHSLSDGHNEVRRWRNR
jgi:hypothetical protein